MTNDDIIKVLKNASVLTSMMDKAHAKDLLMTLMNAQKDRAFFLFLDIKKTVKKILSDLIRSKDLRERLGVKQMKHIYAIMGDYGIYPTCKLCGKSIVLNTHNESGKNQEKQMFTWDHLFPKSLGGASTLDNMQPTHKICNNKKGNNIICNRKYKIQINIEVDECSEYRALHFNLRKQDAWCHKFRQNIR